MNAIGVGILAISSGSNQHGCSIKNIRQTKLNWSDMTTMDPLKIKF